MLTPPPGFVTVSEAFDTIGTNKQCNVVAVVVDSLDSAKTRNDWTVKVTLSDHSGFPGLGAPFRFFNAEQKKLPVIANNGDVLIIRNMRVKDLGGVAGLTNTSTEWALIDGSSLSASTEDTFKDVQFTQSAKRTLGTPTAAELLYAKQILEMTDPNIIQQPAKPTSLQVANIMTANGGTVPSKPNRKFSLVKDIMPSDVLNLVFKDILVEIRRIYKTDAQIEIYVTDYTSHELLYNYIYGRNDEVPDGDAFGYVGGTKRAWPGPHGKFTMQITLWDANARFADRELQEGNYVLLRNVHMKMDRNGSTLEGHCRGDKMNMTKVNIIIVKPAEIDNNEQLRDLVRRKRAIDKAEGSKFVSDPTKLKRREEAVAENDTEIASKRNTARNKKSRDKKRKKRKGNAGEMGNAQDSDESRSKAQPKSETAPRYSANSEVRTLQIAVPPKPIREIVDREILARVTPSGSPFYLPFQNCKYKSQVRVVDFFPKNIADFAAPYRESDYSMLSDHEDGSETDASELDDTDVKWEWRFFLLVEDAVQLPGIPPMRMELLVADEEGDYLLNMEASNLKRNPRELGKLKERLFVLWGDLEELKAEAGEDVTEFKPHNRPFECLIKEYGIEARDENGVKVGSDEYERLFRLWGTTVK
jgi:protection of telomeres protein 1